MLGVCRQVNGGARRLENIAADAVQQHITTPPEPEMKDHILASLRAYGKPIDGIITFADTYWPYVAAAALAMGLPAASPESLNIATNKYLTSTFVGHQAYQASSPAQALSIAQEHELPYPLIVKPCGGWSSEGEHRDAVTGRILNRRVFDAPLQVHDPVPQTE